MSFGFLGSAAPDDFHSYTSSVGVERGMMQSEPKQSELAPYQQLDLWYDFADQGGPPRVLDDMDVSFLHKSFCIAGLPLRAPKNPKEPYTRNDNRFALTIAPNSFMLPGGEMVHVGIPYGPKSRLLAMWMATEVRDHERRPDNRWLEIGRVTHWLRSIGVEPVSGRRGSLNAVKDQLVRLAFSQFTMVMKNGTVGDTMFKSDRLIEFERVRRRRFRAVSAWRSRQNGLAQGDRAERARL